MKIKVITLNILHGGEFLSDILAFIHNEDPDVILLQEVCESSDQQLPLNLQTTSILKNEFPLYNLRFAPEMLWIKESKTEMGNAILSKTPILDQTVTFFDKQYGEYAPYDGQEDFSNDPHNMQHCLIDVGGTSLHIFNVHGIWGFDGEDNETRMKMVEKISKEYRSHENIILAGDFNMFPNTKAIMNIEADLVNVFANELVTTFNLKRKGKGNWATSVVDMMFVSKNIKVVEHYMPRVDISDHMPLVAVLEM